MVCVVSAEVEVPAGGPRARAPGSAWIWIPFGIHLKRHQYREKESILDRMYRMRMRHEIESRDLARAHRRAIWIPFGTHLKPLLYRHMESILNGM